MKVQVDNEKKTALRRGSACLIMFRSFDELIPYSFVLGLEAQKEWVGYKFNWQKMPRQGRNPIEVTSSIWEAEEAS